MASPPRSACVRNRGLQGRRARLAGKALWIWSIWMSESIYCNSMILFHSVRHPCGKMKCWVSLNLFSASNGLQSKDLASQRCAGGCFGHRFQLTSCVRDRRGAGDSPCHALDDPSVCRASVYLDLHHFHPHTCRRVFRWRSLRRCMVYFALVDLRGVGVEC